MIFLDSSFLIAHKIKEDVHHEKALAIVRQIAEGVYGLPIISDYVFDEVVTVIFAKMKHLSASIEAGNDLQKTVKIVYLGESLFEITWEYFQKQRGTALSFTDCSSITLMKDKGILHIATFDEDFLKVKEIIVVGTS